VMVAILILGVGIAGLTQGITTGLASSKESGLQTTAALLAAGWIEEYRADGYVIEGEDEGEFAEPFAQFKWTQSTLATSIDGLYEITVTIGKANEEKPVFELKTMLFDPPLESSQTETNSGRNSQDSSSQRRRERREQ